MDKIGKLTDQMANIPRQIRMMHHQKQANERDIEHYRDLLELDDIDFFDATLNQPLIAALNAGDPDAEKQRTFRYSSGLLSLNYKDRQRVKEKRMELNGAIMRLAGTCRSTEEQLSSLEAEREELEPRIRVLNDQLRDVRNAKDRLYRNAKGATAPQAAPAAAKSPHPRQQPDTRGKSVMTAEDLRNTSFETFELPTELGRFLGQLDRNKTAIALTGDSGAGKSHFAFELTRLFSDEGYRTRYYCLEEGFGVLTQQKIHNYDISPDVEFADQATIADVRRDAGKYDLIVIDSFNKLNTGADDFERLRTDFPRTIFIIIFQKTTTGSIRGGASILFNSAATIDVVRDGDDRVAHMVKGRYGTQGWKYDINNRVVLHTKC